MGAFVHLVIAIVSLAIAARLGMPRRVQLYMRKDKTRVLFVRPPRHVLSAFVFLLVAIFATIKAASKAGIL